MSHRLGVSATLVIGELLLAAPAIAQPQAGATVETVHVVVTGGPKACAYDAIGTKGGCSTGANGPGSWGNALSSPIGDPAAFNSLSLIVPDAKAAAGGTTQFYASFGFGPLMKPTAELAI